jgi:hypothetical protein
VGPTCEVLLETDASTRLDVIDSLLAAHAELVKEARKGRVWDVWVDVRPIHVEVAGTPASIHLSAGCNCAEDYEVLGRLSKVLAESLGGLITPLSK